MNLSVRQQEVVDAANWNWAQLFFGENYLGIILLVALLISHRGLARCRHR